MLDQLFQSILSPQEEQQEEQNVSSEFETPSNVTMVQGNSLDNTNFLTTEDTTQPPAQPSSTEEYLGTYEYPMESWKPIEQGKSPGLTAALASKEQKLSKVNTDFLFGIEKEIANLDIDYVHKAFSLLERKPVIGKKEYDLSKIPELMGNPEYRKQLMQQALELESDPSLKTEDKLALMQSHQEAITKSGMLEHGRKIMRDEMVSTAKWAKNNPKYTKPAKFFDLIIDDKGNFRSEKEYKDLVQKRLDDMVIAWQKDNPFPENAPTFWARTDMPNPARQPVYKDANGKIVTFDPRPKYMDSKEGWAGTLEMLIQGYQNIVNEWGNYNDVKEHLIKAYDDPKSPSTKIRTNFYTKYGPSKGGEEQGELGTIDFDFQNSLAVIPEYGLNVGEAIVKPEAVELTNLILLANSSFTSDNEIRVAIGAKDGSSPTDIKTSSNDAKTVIQNLWEDISDAATRKKDATSRLPVGTLTFSSIVSGGKPYFAYNLKFKSDYIKTDRYIGSKDNPGPGHESKKSSLFTDGITIYVPYDVATGEMGDGQGGTMPVSRLARDNKNASSVSAIEGLFSVKNDVQLTVPGAARLNLTRNPENGETRITGWQVGFNPSTGNMDTIHLPLQVVPVDRATDLDWIADDFYINAYQIMRDNDILLQQHQSKNRVFDPKILQHQNQY